ncbi:sorbosone dehydrogenase family protein [soil metagenome]
MRPFVLLALSTATLAAGAAHAQVRTGAAAFGGWKDDAPGVARRFVPGDFAAPGPAQGPNGAHQERQADPVPPKAPPGFKVELFAKGLNRPRTLRYAPNGDLFLAEMGSGKILVFKGGSAAAPPTVFAEGLNRVTGLLFYPASDPKWLYVGVADKVLRIPYSAGAPAGAAETLVSGIRTEDHFNRDLAIAPDGKHILLGIGSGSNVAEGMGPKPADFKGDGLGAAWGVEENRAVVRIMDPDGKNARNYITGIRNCTAMARQPGSANIWCVVNERDEIGDNTPPEYATAIKAGAYYGWPWYTPLNQEDPRRAGERPDLKGKVTVPDVLFQPHSAPLGIAFYSGSQFPSDYRGDAFVTFRGSWNRTDRTGYKVVRMRFAGGKPTGEYDDFLTGFVLDAKNVWGRPVGVIGAPDGSLLVGEDGSGTLWRITWTGAKQQASR